MCSISRSRPTKLVTGARRLRAPSRPPCSPCSTARCAACSSGEGAAPSSSASRGADPLVGVERVGLAARRRTARRCAGRRAARAAGARRAAPRARRRAGRRGRARARPRRGRRALPAAGRRAGGGGGGEAVVVRSASAGPRHSASASRSTSPARCGVAARAAPRCRGASALEALRVDRPRREPVAAGRGRDSVGVAERAAQPRDQRLQRVLLVGGQVVVPDARRPARRCVTGRPASSASRASSARSRPPATSTGRPSRSIWSGPSMPTRMPPTVAGVISG